MEPTGMAQAAEFWISIGTFFAIGLGVVSSIWGMRRGQQKDFDAFKAQCATQRAEDLQIQEATQAENKRWLGFLMEMVFNVFDVLETGKVNGEVKALRKKAQKFTINE